MQSQSVKIKKNRKDEKAPVHQIHSQVNLISSSWISTKFEVLNLVFCIGEKQNLAFVDNAQHEFNGEIEIHSSKRMYEKKNTLINDQFAHQKQLYFILC